MGLSVQQMGTDATLWRLEYIPELKVVRGEGLTLPMLMVGRRGVILFMNGAARTLVGLRLKSVFEICPQAEVKTGQLVTLTNGGDSFITRLAVIDAGVGRQAIYLMPTEEDASEDISGDIRSSFEKLPVPLLRVATDGAILSFNPSAAESISSPLPRGRVNLNDSYK